MSIAFHLCGLALLALVLASPASRGEIASDLLPVSLTTIARTVSPAKTALPRPSAHRFTPPSAMHEAPAIVHQPAVSTAPRSPDSLGSPSTQRATRAAPAKRTQPAPNVAGALIAPRASGAAVAPRATGAVIAPAAPPALAVSPPTATAVSTPVPTPSASPTAAAANGFSGLFSQNYPPALTAPAVVDDLRTRVGGHGRVRVSVDESGHATAVRFLVPIAEAAAESELRERLLALTYVPADCNGLPCDGTLDISY